MVIRLLCWTLSVFWCVLDISIVGPTPVFRLLTVIIMIAFVYQDLNSQPHHHATYKKLSIWWQSVIWRAVETSSAFSVSQTMGNIQHIMNEWIHPLSETFGELWEDYHIWWSWKVFRDVVLTEIWTTNQPKKYKWKATWTNLCDEKCLRTWKMPCWK
jgi:hypothetical protein